MTANTQQAPQQNSLHQPGSTLLQEAAIMFSPISMAQSLIDWLKLEILLVEGSRLGGLSL